MARHQRMPTLKAGYTYAVVPTLINQSTCIEEESIYGYSIFSQVEMLTDCLYQDTQVPSMAPVARSGFDFKRVVFQRLRNEVAIAQYSFVPDPTLMLSLGMLQGFPAAITSESVRHRGNQPPAVAPALVQ